MHIVSFLSCTLQSRYAEHGLLIKPLITHQEVLPNFHSPSKHTLYSPYDHRLSIWRPLDLEEWRAPASVDIL